jgi:hypothetical protein
LEEDGEGEPVEEVEPEDFESLVEDTEEPLSAFACFLYESER